MLAFIQNNSTCKILTFCYCNSLYFHNTDVFTCITLMKEATKVCCCIPEKKQIKETIVFDNKYK